MKNPVRRARKGQIALKSNQPQEPAFLKLKMEYRDITDIKPYEWNARKNADAVKAVANSIRTFGFLIPVVIDSEGVLGAGHTRVEAAKSLGLTEVPTVQADHLTEAQMNAFRIIDNKVAEIADWDFDMLASEIKELEGLFDMTEYGFSTGELDCLSQLVADDCLSTTNLAPAAEQAEQEGSRSTRRAPQQARFVLGELVMFVPADVYRRWAQGLREAYDFDEEALAEELKRRLGILS